MRQSVDAVSVDDQSISRLRVWMRLLLRALHSRVSGTPRSDGFRAQDFRQADGGGSPCAHALAHPDWHRRDRNRHRNRSISAGRAKVWAHPLDAGSVRATVGTELVDHDQVEPYCPRPRAAQKNKSALQAVVELFIDNTRSETATSTRAARAASGTPAARAVPARAGGDPMQRA